MIDESWRERLATAVDASGKSKRAISLSAGMGAGYIHSLLSEGKDPTVTSLMKIADILNVSINHLVFGANMSALDEEFLHLLSLTDDTEKEAILALLRSRSRASDK